MILIQVLDGQYIDYINVIYIEYSIYYIIDYKYYKV